MSRIAANNDPTAVAATRAAEAEPAEHAIATRIGRTACPMSDAEGWAKDKFGDAAEALRKETLQSYQLAIYVAGGVQPDPSRYLPRPFVVLEPSPSATETGAVAARRRLSRA